MRENKIALGEQVEEDSQPELNHSDAEERKSSSEKEEHQAVQPEPRQHPVVNHQAEKDGSNARSAAADSKRQPVEVATIDSRQRQEPKPPIGGVAPG